MADETVSKIKFETEGQEDVVRAFDDVAKAAEESAAKVTAAEKEMDSAAGDVVNSISGLAGAFKKGLGEGAKGVIEPISTALNKLSGGILGAVVQGVSSVGTAFKTLKAEASNVQANLGGFIGILGRIQEASAGGAGQLSAFASAFRALGPVAGAAGLAIGSFVAAAGLVTAAVVGVTAAVAENVLALKKLADAAGIASRDYQKLVFAFEQTGARGESVASAFARISSQTQQAINSGEKSIGTFKKLGVALVDNEGNARSQIAIFAETVQAISELGEASERNAAKVGAFGRGVGTDLSSGIDLGIGAIDKLGDSLDGVRPDIEGLEEKALAVHQAFGQLSEAAGGLGEQLLNAFGGNVADGISGLANIIGTVNNALTETKGEASILGVTLSSAFNAALTTIIPFYGAVKGILSVLGLFKQEAVKAGEGAKELGTKTEEAGKVIIHNGQTGSKAILKLRDAASEAAKGQGVLQDAIKQTQVTINRGGKQEIVNIPNLKEAEKGLSIIGKNAVEVGDGLSVLGKTSTAAFSEVEKSAAKSLDRLPEEAGKATEAVIKSVDQISASFGNIDISNFSGQLDDIFSNVKSQADQAVNDINTALTQIEIPTGLDFSTIFSGAADAAQAAAETIKSSFSAIDLTGLSTAATDAVTSIQTAFDGLTFTTLEATLDGVFNGAVDAATAAVASVQQAFEGISLPSLESTFDGIFNGAISAAQEAVAAIQSTFDGLTFTNLEITFDGIFNGAVNAANAAVQSIQQAFNTVNFTAIAQAATFAFQSVGQAGAIAAQQITTAFAQFNVSGIVAAFQQLAQAANAAGTAIQSAATRGATALRAIVTAAESATRAMEALKQAADAAFAAAQRANAEAAKGGGRAQGGPIYGRGSSTSDSIPAMLSHGEWVIRAAAVRKYGHAFMAMLNGMRLPRDMLERMLGFADGGMVNLRPNFGSSPLHFASGGAVPSNRTLNLTIGGQSFDGLIAPEDVAEKLVRFALNEKVRSAGRKPGWYTGR